MSSPICVAMSGGVDSLRALLALKDEGREVVAVHGEFAAPADPGVYARLKKICDALDVPLFKADLRERFREEIIEPFHRERARGETPNPCAECNKKIKFGALLEFARELGCAKLATGHYVAKKKTAYADRELLTRDPANPKDQSYFLALLSRAQIDSALFPLGGSRKDETRGLVAAAGFAPPEPKESQDICFIRGKYSPVAAGAPGPVVLRDADGSERIVGTHAGLSLYTEGQRKGLRLPWPEPLYVLEKDRAANVLYVGPRNTLGVDTARVKDPVLSVPENLWPSRTYVKTRSTQTPVPARARLDEGYLLIRFLDARFPVAPGQIAAVYDADGVLLAGGVLARRGIRDANFQK